MDDKIFSISKAAKYLGVFPLTLRNWEKEGKIKVFRTPGGHRRFRRSDLDILLGIENGKGKKLKSAIRNLESTGFSIRSSKKLSKFIEDLKSIVEDPDE